MNKKILTKGSVLVATMAVSFYSFAADSRVFQAQGDYLANDALPLWKTVLLALCFLGGVCAVLFGGWQFLRKFVLPKSDHEKQFTLLEMVASMVVGGLIAYPSGGMLFGQDLTTGDQSVQEIQASDFESTTN